MAQSWRLELLGGASLRGEGVSVETLERKAAALLAYVKLEGPTPRSTAAGLLWPEASEKQARTNLRKLLWNLKAYDGLVTSGDPVSLGPAVEVDVDWLERSSTVQADRDDSMMRLLDVRAAPLLAGLDYDDCPDFHEWLEAERERMVSSYRSALAAEVDRLQASNEYGNALRVAQQLLDLEPLSEVNFRRLMRLHSLVDDRAAALEVYERCRALLARELGVEPLPETVELASAIEAGVPVADKTTLPQPDTPFVGREEELAQLARLLSNPECRLLTLLGPGGIGKTRLAIQVAQGQADVYADGIYFVALASSDTEAQVVAAVASALGFSFYSPRDPRAQLLAYLRVKHLLLVLDNFEHLRACVDLLAELLTSAPSVRILVTSRERIHLKEAWSFVVPYLHVPAGIEDVPNSSSAQLFVEVARRVAPQLELEHHHDAVVGICQLVEGLPLALELAAAWLWALSPQEILQGLAERFAFPAPSAQDLPERHRSLFATYEYSWALLPESERAALRSLAAFRGGFTVDAARAVANAPLSVLLVLVSRSLISRTADDRFEMHELLRQFAQAKLEADRAEVQRVRDRHAQHYATFLSDQGGCVKGGAQQLAAIHAIERDLANIRAAWRWACRHGFAEAIEMALEALWYFEIRSRYDEGLELASRSAQSVPRESAAYGRLLVLQGVFAHRLSDFELCERVSRAGLDTLQRLEAPIDVCAFVNLGIVCLARGDLASARAFCEEGRLDTEARGDRWGSMTALGALGTISVVEGADTAAVAYLDESYRLACAIDDRWGRAIGGGNLGALLVDMDRLDEATTLLLETLEDARALGMRGVVAEDLTLLGDACVKRRDYEEAERMYAESLHYWQSMSEATQVGAEAFGMRHGAHALHGLGETMMARGQLGAALTHFVDAWEHAVRIDAKRSALQSLVAIAEVLVRSGDSELAIELAAFVLANDMLDDTVRARAQRLVEDAGHPPGSRDRGVRLKRARTLSLDAIARRLTTQRESLRRETTS